VATRVAGFPTDANTVVLHNQAQNARFAEKTARELLRFAGLTAEEIDIFVGANIGQ